VVVSWISRAENSLDLAVYSFTHQGIAEALVGAHRRGVAVRVILEEEQAGERSQRPLLENAGIPVRLDTNPYLMHHKFLVVDGRAVLLGSFNYTVSADTRNDEDLLVVEDPSVARAFLEEFEEMWGGVYGR
jgi:phosphatidylserine/phosphatidylglycerophosphate/cardiolipin synthase-like enzyme